MKKMIILIAVLMLCIAPQASAEDFDFGKVHEKYLDYYLEQNPVSSSEAYQYYSEQKADGSFHGVSYIADNPTGAWDHLRKLLKISASAHTSGSALSKIKEEAFDSVGRGIKYWYNTYGLPLDSDGKLKKTQTWWNDTIGQQLYFFIPVMVLSEGYLPDDIKNIGISYLYGSEEMKNYPEFLTGANLVWYENSGIIKGLLTEDFRRLKSAYGNMLKEAEISDNPYADGLQADSSFHQHGSNYYPSYGINFLKNALVHTKMLRNTELYNDSFVDSLSCSMLDGYRWLYRGRYMNLNLLGRQISDKATNSVNVDSYIEVCELLAELNTENENELSTFVTYLKDNNTAESAVSGNKYFWCSDIIVHNRKNYSAAVGMISDRTIGSECNGTQNFYGQYMRLGTVFMDKEGDSMWGYPVFMDWARLPGTTTPHCVEKIVYSGTFMSQREKFVGGVSDGEYGANAMRQSVFQTQANKAWFWFDNEYVALGSDIYSTRNDVNTTIDQRFKKGDIFVDGVLIESGENVYTDVSFVNENNIGYVFPNGADVCIKNGEVKGKWSNIGSSSDSAEYTADSFTLWFNHGDMPKNESYAYIVLPENTPEQTADYSENIPINIVSNTRELQAVYHGDLKTGFAVFHKKGMCRLGKYIVAADRPCILMLREKNGAVEVTVSNPEQRAEEITVTLTEGTKVKEKIYEMYGTSRQTGEWGGSSISHIF